jgi:predicted nucleotide-binding protein
MTALQIFTTRINGFDELARRPSALVPYFAHFLDEGSPGAALTAKGLVSMLEELRLRTPVNPSDTVRKCKLLVRARSGGYRLSHHGRIEVLAALSPKPADASPKANIANEGAKERKANAEAADTAALGSDPSKKNVFVVYGRDEALRLDLFAFLRAIGLTPLEFEEMVHLTGKPSPFTLEVLQAAFHHVQACVVLLSPDESVCLRPSLQEIGDPGTPELQPRPNVLIEAGMAVALRPERTVLVQVGKTRKFSDFDGKQYVALDGSAKSRNKLLHRLQLAGCDAKGHGSDWLEVGKFQAGGMDGK